MRNLKKNLFANHSKKLKYFSASIFILILLIKFIKINRTPLEYGPPKIFVGIPHGTKIYDVENLNVFNFNFLIHNTLSATIISPIMRIIIFSLISAIFMFLLYSKRNIETRYILANFLVFTLTSFLFLFKSTDLPDEAYVWASKIINFSNNGHLGVLLDNGKYGESTVGFLQFFLASLIFKYLHFTVEQSLVIPILISFLLVEYIVLTSLQRLKKPFWIPIVFCTVLIFSPAITLNVNLAFDNIMALTLSVFWIASEYKLFGFQNRKINRLIIIIAAPLIRLDFILLSIIVFIHFVFDLIKKDSQHKSNTLKVSLFIRKIKWELISLSFFSALFIIYKYWAFGELIPAMARFKAPNFNLFYLARGFLYILQSLGYLPFTFLLFSFIWFLKSIKKFNLNNQYLPFFVSLFVFGQILFAVLSGGDYFGPNLARYTFTSCVTFAFFLLLLYFSAENKLIVHQNIFIYFTTFWIAVSLLSGFSFSKVFTQPVNYGFGRTSCELLAAESIKEFLQEHKVGKIQVITSEVNGIPYHLNAKLVDNIGLVDSSLYPMKLEPSSRGNILNRYRVPISLQQIRSSNILWAWGSAACDDWDIYRFLDVNRHMSNFEMLNQIYNHFPANYRFNNLKTYIENGYKVYKIEFRYKLGNSISLRKGQVLALIRI